MKIVYLVFLFFNSLYPVSSFHSPGLFVPAGGESFKATFTMQETDMQLPFLEKTPVIDADLTEWQDYAYHDGVWDIHRIKHNDWYRPDRNRLTDHGNESRLEDDL